MYLDLLYARDNGASSDGATWVTATVDRLGNAGTSPSLALNAAGYPRVSYNRDNCLMYAHYDGTAWQIEPVACG